MKFFRIPFNPDDGDASEARLNRLYKYIQSQSPQDMARLASEISPEVKQIVATNVQTLLGYLPPQEFSTTVMASKENLQNLLASAMLTGYFMHAMENRMAMEDIFEGVKDTDSDETEKEALQETEDVPLAPEDLKESASQDPLVQPSGKTKGKSLRDPRELFANLESLIELPPEKNPEQKLEELGRFLGLEDFKPEKKNTDQKMHIQLEINTHMDQSELTDLLRELRKFQGPEESGATKSNESESAISDEIDPELPDLGEL